MGSDGRDAGVAGGVPPSSGSSDCRDVISESRGGGMGLVISGGGIGGCGSVANEGVNSEATGHHCGIYLESSHLGTVQWDGEDDGI